MSDNFYTLNNGSTGVEEARPAFQHSLFLKMTKTLTPTVVKDHIQTQGKSPAVADIGTGTGIWLRDLAHELPGDARLDGCDFDTSKFPRVGSLPSNVNLSFGNVLKPFPQELLGQYDLDHASFFMFALKANQWESAAANIRTLLTPGGHLVWDETGLASCALWTLLGSRGHASCLQWSVALRNSSILEKMDLQSPIKLCYQLQQAGYVNCSYMDFCSYSELEDVQKLAGIALVNAGRQSLHGVVERGGFEWVRSRKAVEQHFADLQKELQSGACTIGFDIRWTMGQNEKSNQH